MKRYLSTVLVLILASQAFGQQPKVAPDAIRFPVVTQPMPTPTPVVMPTLDATMMYVIEADIPTLLITAPPGLVTVTQSGPVTIRAKFIDGNGGYETKSFTGKTVYQIVAAGKGKCHFFVVPLGLDTKVTDVRTRAVMVDSGQAPQPPPGPTPTPTPGPSPIPDAGFRVMIVEDKEKLSTLPEAQLAIRTSAVIRDYLDAKCVTEPDGKTKAYRIWDYKTDAKGDLKLWQDALARPRTSMPWIIISTGTSGYEGPLPANIDETLKLLKKYGG